MPNFRRRRVDIALLTLTLFAASSWWLRAQQSNGDRPGAYLADPAAVISDDLMTAGETVQVNANVKGDVAAAGADVTIAGAIDGYLLGAGRRVRIDGPIGNDLWAAGETVDVDSTIGNNAIVAGRIVRLRPGAVVGEDARLAGDDVTVEGRIERNLRVGAAAVHIRGPVGGTVHASADRVRIEPGAVIGGDLIVRSPRAPEVSPGAQVSGQIRYEETRRRSWAPWPLVWLVTFAALVVLGVTATTIAPLRVRRVVDVLRSRPGRSLLIGVLTLVLVPVAIAALAVTIVGIPLAAVLLALYVLFLTLSGAFVSQGVGRWLLERAHRTQASPWVQVLLGALVVSLAISVPMVGWAIALAVIVAGMGAFVLEERSGVTASSPG
jgi:cytoskeletal protein CcmA (bactofilin family)